MTSQRRLPPMPRTMQVSLLTLDWAAVGQAREGRDEGPLGTFACITLFLISFINDIKSHCCHRGSPQSRQSPPPEGPPQVE